jgi:phenylacetate-CoA ligase
MLAMQYQLEVSQWWSPEVILQRQLEQLSRLFYHAHRTVPFYKDRLEKAGYKPGQDVTLEMFRRVPLLKRSEVQEYGELLVSKAVPRDHGHVTEVVTSGSTGRPIKAKRTEMAHFFWHALTLRDHLWQQRDFKGKLAVIRSEVQQGVHDGWGPSTDIAYKTGKVAVLNINTDIQAQLQWLCEQAPDYLLSYPSNLHALAQHSEKMGISLSSLRQVRTLGESVAPEFRRICRSVWGVEVVDGYSCQEAGYIALQCPTHEHYHIQAETIYVEVLNDADLPCAPGEIGRVIITPLHNFATTLIRYEVGDYAEVGNPCACGRGLPVLSRIQGRVRNMLRLPNGEVHWPIIGGPIPKAMRLPVRQYQVVQKSLELIEVRVVSARQFTPEETQTLTVAFNKAFGHDFDICWTYVDAIPRSPSGKYEEFVSELATYHG